MFIPKVLKMTDWRSRVVQDRTAFLRDIIKAFLLRIPFQSVTSFGSIKLLERKRPGLKNILDACQKGSGGLCIHSNYYLKLQLDSLGYETQMLPAAFRRTGIPSSHVTLLVKVPYTRPTTNTLMGINHPKDQLYFVDVSCGVPIHEPIPLTGLPYQGRAGGLDFRYEMLGDRQIKRVNIGGDAILGPKPLDFQSPQDYTIELTPKNDLNYFNESFAKIYRSYDTVYFHQGFYLFRYLDISENDFKVVWIRGKELIFATKETRDVTTFDNTRQLQPAIDEYFPMINPHEIELSMQNFSQFQEELARVKELHRK